ncbi:MAG: ROK family protein [Acidimicrobiia bacterium]
MYAIGVDLGGTKLSFGVIDRQGKILKSYRTPTPNSWERMRELINEAYETFSQEFNSIVGLGFGAAGLVTKEGYVFYSPNVPAFDNGVDLKGDLSNDLEIPIFVDNDNNCSGYAEAKYGSAKDYQEVLVVGLGTGIGGVYISEGKPLRGAHGFAGELGHFTIDIDGEICACKKRGCYETIASGTALGKIAQRFAKEGRAPNVLNLAGSIEKITGLHVKEIAENGLEDGLEIMDAFGHNVSLGLVSLTNIFDPELIVISGGVTQMGDSLLIPVKKYFDLLSEGGTSRPMAKIVLAQLGENAGLIGAGALVF